MEEQQWEMLRAGMSYTQEQSFKESDNHHVT